MTQATTSHASAGTALSDAATHADATSATDEIAIRATSLSKRFKIYARPIDRAIEWIMGEGGGPGQAGKKRHTDFWAVRDVSFALPRGECLGILGANGSGKSTLLKMLTGALHATEGSFEVRGRVLSLIELGTGLNPQLTGRQNVFNAARLLNFPDGYAAAKIEDIERFADIAEFFDRPVRTYSSGMTVRLAFSMFACFDPDVLIVDEALSVGDVFFQQKCVQRMDEMRSRGVTMLFVSHDVGKIQRLCTRAILMERGRAVFQGAPEEAVNRYHAKAGLGNSMRGAVARRNEKNEAAPDSVATSESRTPTSIASRVNAVRVSALPISPVSRTRLMSLNILPRATGRHGEGGVRIVAASFENPQGGPNMLAMQHETCTLRLLLRAEREVHRPSAGLQLYDSLSNLVFAAGTKALDRPIPALHVGDEVLVSLSLTCNVAPGQYTFTLGVSEPHEEAAPAANVPDRPVFLDMAEGLGPLVVGLAPGHTRRFYGLAQLPMSAEVARCAP